MKLNRPTKARYQLWQIMLAIAVLAGLFAVFGVTGATAIVVLTGVLLTPILLAGSGRKLRAAAWVASLYPLFLLASLYATWFTAWLVLGHRPLAFYDAPRKLISPVFQVPYSSTILLVVGTPFSLLLGISLALAETVQSVRQRKRRPSQAAARMLTWILVTLLLWAALFVILSWDLLNAGYIFMWFFD
jgi:hypothetical protein